MASFARTRRQRTFAAGRHYRGEVPPRGVPRDRPGRARRGREPRTAADPWTAQYLVMPTTSQRTATPTIRCDATLYTLDASTLVRLPAKASRLLPSRGQVAVQGTLNGHAFETVLEPDGNAGHWMRVDRNLQRNAGVSAGDMATLELVLRDEWPEPDVPRDLATALAAAPKNIQDMWKGITPMARWEWVRWVNATQNPQTRKRRVEVSISKMQSGKRRPCCFNLAACTDPNLSRSGKLMEHARRVPPR
jgi:hypothetical protein